MKESVQKILISILSIGLLMFSTPLPTLAVVHEPLKINESYMYPDEINFYGNSVANYGNVGLWTNKPVKGYFTVTGQGVSLTFPFSYDDIYQTYLSQSFTPWNHETKAPWVNGEYTVTAFIEDEAGNQIHNYTLGTINVVEPEPLPLISYNIEQITSKISPHYSRNENPPIFNIRLFRHANLEIIIKKDDTIYYQTSEEFVYSRYDVRWDGKDNLGKVVPDGEYEVILKATDVHNPSTPTTELNAGTIRVENGISELEKGRLTAIVSNARFNSPYFSPNDDGVQDTVSGTIQLEETANVSVWIVNKLNRHVLLVMKNELRSPGTHTFTWDGTEAWGGAMPNGTYSIKVYIDQGPSAGILFFEDQVVNLVGGYQMEIPPNSKKVKVINPETVMTVQPLGQGYRPNEGDIFTLLSEGGEFGQHKVYITENITGYINSWDSEIIEIDDPSLVGDSTKKDHGIHLVKRGESIWIIAQKYNVSMNSLIQLNKLNPSRYLFIGQELKIPTDKTQNLDSGYFYIVQDGDTLWNISNNYKVSLDQIIRINELKNKDDIRISQILFIPSSNEVSLYTVKAGDSLWKIADQFNTTIKLIAELNNIQTTDTIFIGEKLKVQH
jgi:LysM repeat protein